MSRRPATGPRTAGRSGTLLERIRRYARRNRAGTVGYLLVAPAMLLFAAFAIWPGLRIFFLSLFDYNLVSDPEFIGLDNFVFLAQDSQFHAVVGQTLFYVAGTYVPAIVLALLIALALQDTWALSGFTRTAYFLPIAMSWVAVAVIWRLIFHTQGGVNQLLELSIPWLTSDIWAKWAIVIMSIWKETGFFLILFIAGLRTIPEDVVEASRIDGANAWRRFWEITLPLLMPIIAVCAVMATIRGFQSFSAQMVMTGGAFGTDVLNLLVYKTAFANGRMGRASAIAVIMFLGLFVITLVQLYAFRRRD